jgi:hypothetical protein
VCRPFFHLYPLQRPSIKEKPHPPSPPRVRSSSYCASAPTTPAAPLLLKHWSAAGKRASSSLGRAPPLPDTSHREGLLRSHRCLLSPPRVPQCRRAPPTGTLSASPTSTLASHCPSTCMPTPSTSGLDPRRQAPPPSCRGHLNFDRPPPTPNRPTATSLSWPSALHCSLTHKPCSSIACTSWHQWFPTANFCHLGAPPPMSSRPHFPLMLVPRHPSCFSCHPIGTLPPAATAIEWPPPPRDAIGAPLFLAIGRKARWARYPSWAGLRATNRPSPVQ